MLVALRGFREAYPPKIEVATSINLVLLQIGIFARSLLVSVQRMMGASSFNLAQNASLQQHQLEQCSTTVHQIFPLPRPLGGAFLVGDARTGQYTC